MRTKKIFKAGEENLLNFTDLGVALKLMRMRAVVLSSVSLTFACLFGWAEAGLAAPDFKIRYNPKFPCLEVMDGKAVKITDISEGSKGETVTSGKATLKISFLKNASGQPEVTMTEAKSALSEMELEAFGLSVVSVSGRRPVGRWETAAPARWGLGRFAVGDGRWGSR